MNRMIALAITISLVVADGLFGITDRSAARSGLTPVSTASAKEERVITVGSISRTQREEIATFKPLVDYLARRLSAQGIAQGRVVVASSILEMADLLKKGAVDIVIDSPFPVAILEQRAGARPFLRRWKKGKVEYHTVIFARRDSGIETLHHLKGKMIAFEEPYSTSGYLLPKATLLKTGLTVTEYADPSARVSAHEVGYVFTNDEENTMFWVLRKKVLAGALNSDDFERLTKHKRDEFKILAKTIDVPRHVVSHRADLHTRLVGAIGDVLVAMDRDEEGKMVLAKFEKTAKFDRFPHGAEETFRHINVLVDFLGREWTR